MTAGRILGLAALGALCGCSLLLDTDEFHEAAARGNVRIDDWQPRQALEGAMLPVILHGEGFSDGVTVTAKVVLPDGKFAPVDVPERLVSPNGTELGLRLDVPVLPDHDPDDPPARVQIIVAQGRSETSTYLDLEALPELELGNSSGTSLVNTADLENLYSQITVDGAVRVTGDDPLRLVATNVIRINRLLDASGQNASRELPGAGGPSGCRGGAGGSNSENGRNGDCDLGGGQGGATASGTSGPAAPGGGGGCAPPAPGNDPAAPDETRGDDTCTADLVPLGKPDNRGHGGGGGGAFETAPGGHGGGGGGAVELSAPFIELGVNAEVLVRGGQGGSGEAVECSQNRHAGAGGGGSGGVVLLRADHVLFRQEGPISVDGGPGGVTCSVPGGTGSDGQVRIDVASLQRNEFVEEDPGTLVAFFSRNVSRGPRLGGLTPRLALRGAVGIQVRGDSNVTYDLRVDSDPPVSIRGNQIVPLVLARGLRSVCVVLRGVDPAAPESKHCQTIAVLDS